MLMCAEPASDYLQHQGESVVGGREWIRANGLEGTMGLTKLEMTCHRYGKGSATCPVHIMRLEYKCADIKVGKL